MAEINLLPEEFRAKDEKAREESAKKTTQVDLSLTSPDKSKDKTVKKNFWKKITGAFRTPKEIPSQKKSDIQFAPAHKKIVHNRKEGASLHVPKTSVTFGKKPKEIQQDKHDKDVGVKHAPLINPHMADFQEDKKIERQQREDFELHKPEKKEKSSTINKKSVPIVKAKSETKSDTKFSVQKKDENVANRAKRFSQNIIYKVTHKKHGDRRISVNLMPARRLSLKDVSWGRIGRMLVVSVGGATLITVLWYLVLLDKEQQSVQEFSDIRFEIDSLEVKLRKLEDEQQEALLLKNKLDVANSLIDNHVYWSQFLSLLEELTLDGVHFSGLSADNSASNVINLTGITDNLETVYWQRETFRESDKISDANVIDTTASTEETITFALQISIKPSVWRNN